MMGYVADALNRCLSYGDETEWFEYKKGEAVSDPDEIGEYISALSNGAAMSREPYGYMFWGVHNETHVVTGTKFSFQRDVSDDKSEPFQHYLGRNLSPRLFFRFEEEEIDGKRIVGLVIPAAQSYPTSYKGERYIRIGSSKENLRKYPEREAALFQILNEKKNPTDKWETQLSRYHIVDINKPLFDDYLKKAKAAGRLEIEGNEPESVLNSIEVADGATLLNAGAAVFVDSGINEVQITRFPTDERLTILDTKRYTGSILKLADKVVLYISDAMDWRAEFDGSVSRKEIPEVPVEAIREAVINAFAHRQIESRQAVDISIYKSFIDVYSPGLFPENLEPRDFIHKNIKPPRRNPLITKTLYYSKDMEAVATGFKRIDSACTSVGVKYELIKEEYGFTVRFHRHCGEGWGEVVHGSASNAQADAQPATSTDRILEYCCSPKSMKEIQSMLGVKDPRTARKYVHRLIEAGQMSMTMPEVPNHPDQKYLAIK